jgi:HK97 family phage major capsid protein/HK97 family phage prohead protease
MSQKHIKPGSIAHRAFALDRAAIDDEARTVELSFSSELPYERMWGVEILDHSPKSIRLGRLTSGGPLLMDHDTKDQVGVIESVRIGEDRVGRAVVRFGRSARADEVFQDVKDEIRRNVSVGYVIHRAVLQETRDDQEIYRVSDWEPFEVSLVSVPADASVGIGRSADTEDHIEIIEPDTPASTHMEIPAMENQEKSTPAIDIEAERNAARTGEQKRVADIMTIGKQFAHYGTEDMVRDAVSSGATTDQFRQAILEKVGKNKPVTADIGLTEKETRQFSFVRAINAMAATGADARRAREAAAFEIECSQAVGEKLGKEARGIFVPSEVQRRDLTVGTATAGGHTVATELLASSFIDLLRNRMSVMRAGARMLTGLVGNIAIPRQTGAAAAYWVAESGAPTEGQQAFDQVTMSPKTVGAFTDISRKLLLQSSIDVEALVRTDLATVLGLEIDRAGLNGSAADNQPRGILQTAGIGSVVGGTNGLAPSWEHIVELWSDVAAANADFGTTGYLTNSKVVGKLMTTEKATGTAQFVCPGFPDASGVTSFGGARAVVSNQVPSNLDKGTSVGVCSAIVFGNWADLIVGMWGGLDLTVDPYTHSTSGTVRVVALQDVDIAVRHAESFSAMLDALTA